MMCLNFCWFAQNAELERQLAAAVAVTSQAPPPDAEAPPPRDALLQQLKRELQQKESIVADLRDQLDDQVGNDVTLQIKQRCYF